MTILKITTKGQVTLRRDLLKHLGVDAGEKVAVEMLPDGRLEVRAVRPAGQIADVFDLLKRPGGPTLTLEEIDETAAAGWAGTR